jgi:hypothetical protein
MLVIVIIHIDIDIVIMYRFKTQYKDMQMFIKTVRKKEERLYKVTQQTEEFCLLWCNAI